MKDPGTRTYRREECAVFRKTTERFGGLSNMAAGFPLEVSGLRIRTSEALYQACRFPHRPELQRIVLAEASPMTAKMRTKPHRKDTRPDWDDVRITIMRWALRVKLAQHLEGFGQLLLATGDGAIVEESRRDEFWGARPRPDGTLVGANVMGRLLRELRDELKSGKLAPGSIVEPPALEQFALCGRPIEPMQVREPRHAAVAAPAARPRPVQQPLATAPGSLVAPSWPAPTPRVAASRAAGETPDMTKTRKKLIEVALPLDAINVASAKEKSIRHGHPSTLHLWWARRPLAAARAVIFSQMVDDPAAVPEEFPTEEAQEAERTRLFTLIEELVKWENTTNESLLQQARNEIWRSWRRACADNADHPRAAELFNPEKLPAFHDPFAGGGSLPLEAQRLGLEAYASDLNPVAVLINKAMIEIPPKYAGMPPVNPDSRKGAGSTNAAWKGAAGLAEDVRYYGKWMRDEAEKRIGHLYPKVAITPEVVAERPDLKVYVGQELTVIAWIWARTVKSPNPAFRAVDVPLASTFMLSAKPGQEAYVEPVIQEHGYYFTVKSGNPRDMEAAKNGTKISGANFRCLMSDSPLSGDYIKAEGNAKRMGARLMAIVAEGDRGRVYLGPNAHHENVIRSALPDWKPEVEIAKRMTGGNCTPYGLSTFGDLFSDRQLVALNTFSDLVGEARMRVQKDAETAGVAFESHGLGEGGRGSAAYAQGLAVYLALTVSRSADRHNTLCSWDMGPATARSSTGSPARSASIRNAFSRQALPMSWDYAEGNPFSESATNFSDSANWIAKVLERITPAGDGNAQQRDAARDGLPNTIVSTDPPYYDNIGYADLSDFFYVWLRRSLSRSFQDLFATVAVPKGEELVATAHRHGSRAKAEAFFLDGMTEAMRRLAERSHPGAPVTIYYAFKQSEKSGVDGSASTGWETFLEAVIRSGFALTGTWPVRTELANRMIGSGANALASSIVLVCRPRPADAPTATRAQFNAALRAELPNTLKALQHGNIAPVDLAQAAIGPGMAVFTRYARVLDATGEPMKVREALALINQVLDEALAEQEGDFDADSRWALAWFEQAGFSDGQFGVAETLSKAKNTSIGGLEDAGILKSGRGVVRLLRPAELDADWDPEKDRRLTAWESVHQLVRALETGGESAAAEMAAKLGSHAEAARELCYRLYTLCERKKRAAEALSYNSLVQSWPEIMRLAQDISRQAPQQPALI